MTIRHEPLVSIGMPVLNVERTIVPALRSIVSQTYANWELLLLDDGSEDRTSFVINEFSDPRIRFIRDGQARGLPRRLNEAIKLARGKYFARMDGDDVSYPGRLEQQVRFLEDHPEIDLVGAWVLVFRSDGVAIGKRAPAGGHDTICRRPHAGFPLAHPTFLGRLEWFCRFGYRLDAVRCEDQDLLLRAHTSSRYANLEEILLGYREDNIPLRKVLRGRRSYACSVLHNSAREHSLALALRGVSSQLLKGAVDCVAVATGLGHKLLRHRARPVSESECQRWHEVWESVTE
jgi:glycosyltransferase involved in cell wall biosynthesis